MSLQQLRREISDLRKTIIPDGADHFNFDFYGFDDCQTAYTRLTELSDIHTVRSSEVIEAEYDLLRAMAKAGL